MNAPVKLKLIAAKNGLITTFRKPLYALLAAAVAFVTLGLILWSLNLGLVKYILFEAPLGIMQKADFILSIYGGFLSSYESLQVVVLSVFSVLFGINAALLVYVIRQGNKRAALSGSSAGGLVAAIVSGGCIACGTSLLAPILSSFGAAGTIGLTNTLSNVFGIAGIALIGYSIFSLGQKAASLR